MGRPWWYDSYWEKERPSGRRTRMPRRKFWLWLALIVASLFFGLAQLRFHVSPASWTISSVEFLCQILSVAVLVRAILSWVTLGRYNMLVVLLDDATEPILWPLRRVIPLIGRFDITPVVAIVMLSIIPYLVSLILSSLT